MLETVLISGEDVCCSVVFVLSVMWSELLMTSAISCPLWSSVYECHKVCYVCDVLYAVLYVRVSCFVVRGCAVSRRYIDVCYRDIYSVVNVYHDHLKFCVVCIHGEDMSVVVNVMLSLMSVISPPPALCNLSFMLTCSMKFLSLLLLGMCACVVFVVLW